MKRSGALTASLTHSTPSLTHSLTPSSLLAPTPPPSPSLPLSHSLTHHGRHPGAHLHQPHVLQGGLHVRRGDQVRAGRRGGGGVPRASGAPPVRVHRPGELPLTHSLVLRTHNHALPHLLSRWLPYLVIHQITHHATHHSLTYSLTHSLSHPSMSLIHPSIHPSRTHSLTHHVVYCPTQLYTRLQVTVQDGGKKNYFCICIPCYNESMDDLMKTVLCLLENIDFMKHEGE